MLLLPRLPHRTVVAAAAVAQREAAVGHTAAAAVAELAGEALVQRNTLVPNLLPVPIVELVEEAPQVQFQLLVAFVFVAVEVLIVAVLVIE
jgi:hypothetical protein